MGKRDDRLHSPRAFQQALMTRPVVRTGLCMIYKIPCSDGTRLGFVLPKKLVKYAVQRNQIKRWARALFRQARESKESGFALVVRVKTSLPKAQWREGGRAQMKQDLIVAMEKALMCPIARSEALLT